MFREVRRLLRHDGTVWLNIGDTYAGSRDYQEVESKNPTSGGFGIPMRVPEGLKPKDLVGIPWRVALALQADGWYIRSEVIWEKGSAVPESAKDRPTRSHEQVFLLSRSRSYFYDHFAVREPRTGESTVGEFSGRNRRSVWTINQRPTRHEHTAAWPQALVELMVLAGTSPHACQRCGCPWERIVERENDVLRTTGWAPTCACEGNDGSARCVVLDPFSGSGTTGVVALQQGRDYIGIDINPKYLELAKGRLEPLVDDGAGR